ncbi:protein FAR-RED ELONGATED HYPOCOTYL 3-like [Cucumis melo var. makuwa]|uniref:Protein FAR-RED ELONGATED HYPOCOTYL 3-like n=1 Tax=Cucumis melo var. makuwa TaxID=1194695 RepID=A0A5D3CZW0_CUCMM|nr:protein FAR-RED ELONGATED HYPOCOTYL 3-like [Cucumis melo var. makuwa]
MIYFVVVDTVSASDIGNTPYLSSELPRAQDSRNENGIIDLDAFESSHTGPIVHCSILDVKIRLALGIYVLRQTTSWIISECAKSIFKMNDKAPCCPSDVINYMKIHRGVNVSYDKAWRGREIALNFIRGTYMAEEADNEVDGASMKNKYLDTLISACTIDDNSQIVPLAFAVVDSGNDLSWTWFFWNLKVVFREHNEMVIVSDAHKTYTPLEFEYYMRQLEQLSPSIRHELEAVGKQSKKCL